MFSLFTAQLQLGFIGCEVDHFNKLIDSVAGFGLKKMAALVLCLEQLECTGLNSPSATYGMTSMYLCPRRDTNMVFTAFMVEAEDSLPTVMRLELQTGTEDSSESDMGKTPIFCPLLEEKCSNLTQLPLQQLCITANKNK